MYLSVVLPAFNESRKIGRDLEALRAYLCSKDWESEVLVVDDGSRDDTAKVVENFIRQLPPQTRTSFRLLGDSQNRGKGYAVRTGISHSKGKRVAFVDAGLCVPIHYLDSGLEKLAAGFDYAIGSRRLAQTKVHNPQPIYRQMGSKVFSFVVRTLMGVNFVSDTQCGFKLYTREAAKDIFSRTTIDGFMFDIEALIIAKDLKLKGTEFAIDWSNDGDTRYHPLWGTIRNFRELMRIRWNRNAV